MNAFYQTTINYTGQNVGAHRYDRVKKIVLLCSICVTITGILLGGGAFLACKQLLSVYITDSPEAISYGITRLMFIGLPYFLCGLMEVSTGGLRGMGASMAPMIISVLGVCGIRLGWIYTIFRDPRFHSLESLFFSYTISWTITLIIQFVAFVVVYRRHVKRFKAGTLHP
jgi:Na+-driven multidrug efflux pump